MVKIEKVLNILIAIVVIYIAMVIFCPMGEEDLGAVPAGKQTAKKVAKKIRSSKGFKILKGDAKKLFNRTRVLADKVWKALMK